MNGNCPKQLRKYGVLITRTFFRFTSLKFQVGKQLASSDGQYFFLCYGDNITLIRRNNLKHNVLNMLVNNKNM